MTLDLLPLFEPRKPLIKYLPTWMRPYYEFRVLFAALEKENEEIDTDINKLFCNLFILFADADGIKAYEDIMGVKPSDNQTLEERKSYLLNKITSYPPYTKIWLNEKLEFLIGAYGFEIDIWNWLYEVNITLEQANRAYVDAVKEVFKDLPANLKTTVTVRKNLYAMLKSAKLTYATLEAYTHEQLQDSLIKEADMLKNRMIGIQNHYRRQTNEKMQSVTYGTLKGFE